MSNPSSSCYCDFPIVVNCNLEQWTKISVFLHEFVLFRSIRKLLLCLVTSHLPLFGQGLGAQVLPRVGKSIHDRTSRDQVNIVCTEQITHPWSSSMSCALHYDSIGWITKKQLISDSDEIAFCLWCRKMLNHLAHI